MIDQTSFAARRPAAPTILYRDDTWQESIERPKIWIPDSRSYRMEFPTEVTWYFENIEDFTAAPYVAEIPTVDFLGFEDRKSKALLFEGFYIYGIQLKKCDLEYMETERWSIMKFVDTLIKSETNDAENIFTRIFDRKRQFKNAGLMWLPFLDGTGITAKIGYTPPQPFEPLPVYTCLLTSPPPYCEVELKHTATDVVKSDLCLWPDAPPSYEDAIKAMVPTMVKEEEAEAQSEIEAEDSIESPSVVETPTAVDENEVENVPKAEPIPETWSTAFSSPRRWLESARSFFAYW
ncbi:hypothetical protein GGR57DRAFT_494945 [Xylariaceae sp. FL1272]|nr:hypothetical protein GGR57DRAFT_494945 [Xylariaceae sp. FL1272]